MPRTFTVTIPDVITRTIRVHGSVVEVSYNDVTGEVVCLVDGLKLLEQPEAKQLSIRCLMAYSEGYAEMYNYCNVRFQKHVLLAPIRREFDGIQIRINAKSARLAAKRKGNGDYIHQVGGSN